MKTIVLTLAMLPVHPTPDAARLRARAALALAFADAKPATYPEQYARALKEGKPLVVWVGQRVRPVNGCVSVSCESFPGVAVPAVVVGLPTGDGKLARIDLPGEPTDAAVRQALRAAVPSSVLVIPPR